MTKCIFFAAKKSTESNKKEVNHWIDRASPDFDIELIRDVKSTLRVLLLFSTFPLFWALFYQSSTGMIFQAKRLYDYIGDYRVPPELTSSINPLLILILIPLFDLVIYPLCAKYNFFQKTTTRMIVGMIFSTCSFLIYAAVGSTTEQALLGELEARLHIYNARNSCSVKVEADWIDKSISDLNILPLGQKSIDFIELKLANESRELLVSCSDDTSKTSVTVNLSSNSESTLLITDNVAIGLNPSTEYIKHVDAEAKVRLISPKAFPQSNFTLRYKQLEENLLIKSGASEYMAISPQMYEIVSPENTTLGNANIRQDGVYDILILEKKSIVFPVTEPVNVHVLALIPQYLILTIGEVLFSVSSMDFAYSQAPASMKAVMQAANLFTITIGLWIYAILNSVNAASGVFLHRPSWEALSYAILMGLNTIVFIFLIKRFQKSSDQDLEHQMQTKSSSNDASGIDNPAYQ